MAVSRNATARQLAGHAEANGGEPVSYLSPKQVAEITSLSTRQIDRLVKAGKFPKPVPLTDRRRGFIRQEVFAWTAQRFAEARAG
jgi:prophage regulatory protein